MIRPAACAFQIAQILRGSLRHHDGKFWQKAQGQPALANRLSSSPVCVRAEKQLLAICTCPVVSAKSVSLNLVLSAL